MTVEKRWQSGRGAKWQSKKQGKKARCLGFSPLEKVEIRILQSIIDFIHSGKRK
jgi:hypothetical protein